MFELVYYKLCDITIKGYIVAFKQEKGLDQISEGDSNIIYHDYVENLISFAVFNSIHLSNVNRSSKDHFFHYFHWLFIKIEFQPETVLPDCPVSGDQSAKVGVVETVHVFCAFDDLG